MPLLSSAKRSKMLLNTVFLGKTNQSLLKIRQQLQRISEILELLVIDDEKM